MVKKKKFSKSLQPCRRSYITKKSTRKIKKSNMEKDMIEDARFNTPLLVITEAFEDLADSLKPRWQKRSGIGKNDVVSNDGLRLDAFCSACTHVSVLFGCLGFAFKFAEMEYVSKVRNPPTQIYLY